VQKPITFFPLRHLVSSTCYSHHNEILSKDFSPPWNASNMIKTKHRRDSSSIQRRNKWKFPSLMSILSPQTKVNSTRSKSFINADVRSQRNVFLSSSFGSSRDRSVHRYSNTTGFTWNPFAPRSYDSSNIANITILQTDNDTSQSTQMATRRPSAPLLIKSRNSSLFSTPTTSSCSSFNNSLDDQTIRANQYLYNMATWRMYKRIENARAQKRMVEGINVNHIPNAYIPGNDTMGNNDHQYRVNNHPEEKENMISEHTGNFERSNSDHDHEADLEGDEHSIQFHIDL